MTTIAIDVGGVLASKQHDGQPIDGSMTAIELLDDKGFNLWIVSQCGKARARGTKKWLYDFGFDVLIPEAKQIYIGFDEQNKNRVLRQIKADYFIDDRWKHIRPACDIAKDRAITCFHLTDTPAWPPVPSNYIHVISWKQIVELVCIGIC